MTDHRSLITDTVFKGALGGREVHNGRFLAGTLSRSLMTDD